MRFDGLSILIGLITLSLGVSMTGCADEAEPAPQVAREGEPCRLEGSTYQQLICKDGRWTSDKPDDDMSACIAEANTSFCMRQGSSCGLTTGKDNCGSIRTISCGDCPQGSCQSNACSCSPEDNATFCARLGKTCGQVAGMDNCMQPRTVECGSCLAPEVCLEDNTCSSCTIESDADFCARLGKDCGQVMDMDNCMQARTANCGMCTAPATCQADHTCN